ncbi:uncharacterized protein TM35_000151710 [Trypanosoma theileri]|uniref:Mucin-associated surface protein (MASP) n=1 Tax=Trypanosoma theileri TaxID=67003 RepID=A0A1X0NX90_9TRYP|nr:uncharacterized protein TM35_000151710 [Trypanosoma theileri]ORC88740.1 hypothetical protein TM35_000151710 [Trypanosoma theileri]
MMKMNRVMCVLAVLLCFACGYTMAAAATTAAGQPKAVMAEFYGSYDTALLKEEWDKKQKEKELLKQQELNKQKVTAPLQTPERLQPETHPNEETTGDLRNQKGDSAPSPEVKRPEGVDTPVAAAAETTSQPSPVVEVVCMSTEEPHLHRADNTVERPCETNKTGPACEAYKKLCKARADSVFSGLYDPNVMKPNNNRPTGSGDADTTSPVTQGDQEASNSNGGNSTPVNSNPNQEPPAAESSTTNENTANQQSPPAAEDATTPSAPQENSNADSTTTTPSSPENTTTEAPSTTPTPSTDAEISTIAPTEQNSANADSSSISPLWMRTAAPLLIVAALVL